MERWRAFLPIIIAVIIAVLAAVMVNKWLKKQALVKGTSPAGEILEIVVASADLPLGTRLTPEMLTLARFFKKTL